MEILQLLRFGLLQLCFHVTYSVPQWDRIRCDGFRISKEAGPAQDSKGEDVSRSQAALTEMCFLCTVIIFAFQSATPSSPLSVGSSPLGTLLIR